MLDDLSLDKRGLHRRLTGGLKRVNNKRVYTPTAIFTHWDTETDTTTAPADPTTSDPVLPSTTNPITSSSPVLSISIPGVVLTTTSSTTSSSVITTSSSATPTTTSTTPPPTTTTTPPSTSTTSTSTSVRVAPTPLQDATTEVRVTVTSTPPQSQSATSLAASPTSSTAPTSGISTGAVVGGIIAAVVAVAGILFAIIYFVRRSRQSSDDDGGNDFDPDAFRRQSMMLPDDGASGMARAMTYTRGGARPPTMIEQRLANAPVSYSPAPMQSHPYNNYPSYNSFSPGQVVTPTTMNSANPFFSQYSESPMASPVTSVPAYESAYDAQGNPMSRHPSVSSTAVLSRHTSAASNKPLPDPAGDAQYVDMSRSSVTPFQAQQYAEISRRLNTTPPQALPLGAVAEEYDQGHEVAIPVPVAKEVEPLELQPQMSFDEGQRLTVQPTPRENSFPESPFADPTMAAEQRQHIPQRDSGDSFLQAPEPAFAKEKERERERITSIPPTLPDIQIEQRPFSPVTIDFPAVPSSVHATPSPFSTSFSIPSPPPNAHFAENQNRAPSPVTEAPPAARAPAVTPISKRPDTVYTLYDEEDAYGGI